MTYLKDRRICARRKPDRQRGRALRRADQASARLCPQAAAAADNVDLNKAVADIAKLLRPTLGEQIEIATILTKDVTLVHVDASQLASAVVNLAINARDAMPSGGKLLLETCNTVLDETYVAANPDTLPGHYVMLAISDTGTGMPPEVLERVFEPFFTTKEIGKGTGLGPFQVYGFVKQSGGHINIYIGVAEYLQAEAARRPRACPRRASSPRGRRRSGASAGRAAGSSPC